jgi:hypothetical protein
MQLIETYVRSIIRIPIPYFVCVVVFFHLYRNLSNALCRLSGRIAPSISYNWIVSPSIVVDGLYNGIFMQYMMDDLDGNVIKG